MSGTITPEDVLEFKKPTDGFLCPLAANTYNIEFLHFCITDYDTKNIIFEVGKDQPAPQDMTLDFTLTGEDMYRKIKYTFSEDVLRLPFVQTSLCFSVGQKEMRGFRMIERHYFENKLVKSFDFDFGFCIPGSTNTWDAVYTLPPLEEEMINDMIARPYDTQSDSFYFVDDKLIMHNKAAYRYVKEDAAQEKRSYEDKYGSKGSRAAKGAKGAKASNAAVYIDDNVDCEADDKGTFANTPGSKGSGGAKAAAKEPAWSKDDDYF